MMRFSTLLLVRRKEMNSICLSVRLRSTKRNGIRYRRPILSKRSRFVSIRGGDASLRDPECRESRPGDWGLLDAVQIAPVGALPRGGGWSDAAAWRVFGKVIVWFIRQLDTNGVLSCSLRFLS